MKIKELMILSVLSLATATTLYGEGSAQEMDNITVTANKVEENIQDVPQSITVISGEILEERGIKTIVDVINEIPNMTSIPDRGVKVNFRGLNASLFTENNPIVVYVDGIPTSFKRAFTASLENVERIEVLRGPQGTLYGKDAIGGVINIITKKPTNETSGNIGFEYGSDNYKRTTFNINTPIIDNKLFFNLNGEITSTDGWINNKYKNDKKAAKEDDKSFGTSLYYKVTDNLSTKLVLKKEKIKNYGFKGYGIVGSTNFGEFKRNNAENTSFEEPMLEKNDIDSQSIDIKYEADNYILDAVTVHRKTSLKGNYDADFTNGTILDGSNLFNDASSDTYSQELRLSNKETDGIRWVAGLYLDKEEKNKDAYGSETVMGGVNFGKTNTVSSIDSTTQAVFGQAMIPLNKQLKLTLGGRYQKIKREIDLNGFSNTTKNNEYNDKRSWNVFIPKVALDYKINENFSPYVSVSKGYMPGGFNVLARNSKKEDNRFEPERSTNYEIGIKGSVGDFMFTAAIFRMDIKDIHINRQETVGATTNYYTDNADKAHSEGIEFDFRYFPTDRIEVSGALGFIKTKYDSYVAGDNDFSGKEIETTPSHTANLSVAYYHPNGFYARTDVRNQGSMSFYDDAHKTFPKEDGYTLVDVKVGYKFSDWDIYVYGKNLTDEKYINTYEANSLFTMATFGDPRFFGIGARYRF
ncbi:TonB-dependent receptor [Arcobacter sp. F2176]|uniref:TonB-dependent receptor n=1 Tax=Arcobacter sp. F2176 TaxID=2044511 RepID=UPI00100A7616|nr:TonB-dependent receptor [Arcobacter sp. F2176]RXJ81163.1 TonB-dependent siderophore receptor [Arcobacter sp. F2176]